MGLPRLGVSWVSGEFPTAEVACLRGRRHNTVNFSICRVRYLTINTSEYCVSKNLSEIRYSVRVVLLVFRSSFVAISWQNVNQLRCKVVRIIKVSRSQTRFLYMLSD